MSKQLRLIEQPRSWRLDADTKRIGREGISKARAALREATTERDVEQQRRRAA